MIPKMAIIDLIGAKLLGRFSSVILSCRSSSNPDVLRVCSKLQEVADELLNKTRGSSLSVHDVELPAAEDKVK